MYPYNIWDIFLLKLFVVYVDFQFNQTSCIFFGNPIVGENPHTWENLFPFIGLIDNKTNTVGCIHDTLQRHLKSSLHA